MFGGSGVGGTVMVRRGSGRRATQGLGGDGIWLLLKRSLWQLPELIAEWEVR